MEDKFGSYRALASWNQPVKKKAEETSKLLSDGCAALGLEVRSGCFEQ